MTEDAPLDLIYPFEQMEPGGATVAFPCTVPGCEHNAEPSCQAYVTLSQHIPAAVTQGVCPMHVEQHELVDLRLTGGSGNTRTTGRCPGNGWSWWTEVIRDKPAKWGAEPPAGV